MFGEGAGTRSSTQYLQAEISVSAQSNRKSVVRLWKRPEVHAFSSKTKALRHVHSLRIEVEFKA